MPSNVIKDQDQVLTRAQLLGLGHSRGHLEAQVTAKRWRALTSTVYALHNGPLTQRQQWWAAALAVGPLAGRTALQAWGIKGWSSDRVEVVVARGAQPELPEGVSIKVHESRRFEPGDVAPQDPPRTHLERSAIDAAAWTRDPRAACGLLAAVVQQRRTTATRLSAELRTGGQVRHVALLRSVLQDIEGGAQALSEVDLGKICARAGLELVERQVVRHGADGKRRYVDARVLSRETGKSALVEVDGALHLLVASYWDDMERGNELVIGGSAALRFPSIAFRLDPDRVIDQLRRACGLPSMRSERRAA